MSDKLSVLSDILGEFRRVGDEYLFFCKFCSHHKRKLSTNLKKNAFKCWVCGKFGKLGSLVRRFGSREDVERWRQFDKDAVDLSEFVGTERENLQQLVQLPDMFVSLVKNNSISLQPARNYLYERGLTENDILRWKVGFCVGGEYENHVIFPSFSLNGALNYFVARTIKETKWNKYKNPPVEKETIIFNELFLDFGEMLVLCEGVFDAVTVGDNAVPILGSALNEQYRLFREIVKNNTPVCLVLDADAKKKQAKIAELLLEYDIDVWQIDLAPYKDLGEMPKKEWRGKKEKMFQVTRGTLMMDSLF